MFLSVSSCAPACSDSSLFEPRRVKDAIEEHLGGALECTMAGDNHDCEAALKVVSKLSDEGLARHGVLIKPRLEALAKPKAHSRDVRSMALKLLARLG